MNYDELLQTFSQFGLAVLVGTLLGLERELRRGGGIDPGLRDFVLFALIGAFSAYLAARYDALWVIALGFAGILSLIISAYWADRAHGPGITSELAGLMTFFLGVLILSGAQELAIALAIVTLGVLFPKATIKQVSARVSPHELKAVFLFLTISFLVLPILPNQTMDHLVSFDAGTVTHLDAESKRVTLKPTEPPPAPGSRLEVFDKGWDFRGTVIVSESTASSATARLEGEGFANLAVAQNVRKRLDAPALYVMLAALNPYRIWLIVVLVSFVSFLGYVLSKTIGSDAGIGLTGMIGGLVSSTATTLSFARRSQENAAPIPLFAAAIILASSIMFPRLIIEIGLFNAELMKNIVIPLAAMGLFGMLLAAYAFRYSRRAPITESQSLSLDNPFNLRSAVAFAAIFAIILWPRPIWERPGCRWSR